MVLNSTKFGGNRTIDVEVGLNRRTDRGMQGAVQEVKENFLPGYLVCNHNSYK
jgi:hypothetical protein